MSNLNTELTLNHLYRPSNKENSGVFVLIHGYGSHEDDLYSFEPDLPKDYAVISVRAPLNTDFGGYAWYSINFSDLDNFANIPEALESKQKLHTFILEACSHYNLDAENIWLCGFSQGCILSYSLALNHPFIYKKVIGMSGYPDMKIIENLPESINPEQKFYISHGTADNVVPVQLGRMGKDLLEKMKVDHSYNEYNAGHNIVMENYKDLMSFIEKNK